MPACCGGAVLRDATQNSTHATNSSGRSRHPLELYKSAHVVAEVHHPDLEPRPRHADGTALSYTIRTMEARLGVRLLTRTTRSVSLTEAGERLIGSIGPRFDEIESEISALSWHRPLDHGLDGSRVERPRRFCPTIFALHHVSRSCQSRRRARSAAVFPLKRWRAHLSSVPPKFVRPCIPITAKAIPRGDE